MMGGARMRLNSTSVEVVPACKILADQDVTNHLRPNKIKPATPNKSMPRRGAAEGYKSRWGANSARSGHRYRS